MVVTSSRIKWVMNPGIVFLSCMTVLVFLFLDILEYVLCPVYKCLDEYLEGTPSSCYCDGYTFWNHGENPGFSRTFIERTNIVRKLDFFSLFRGKRQSNTSGNRPCFSGRKANRWSDCGCQDCVAWMKDTGDPLLHVVVREPPIGEIENNMNGEGTAVENVIFLHGFLCSSSFWTQTLFPSFTGPLQQKYRLFGVDLLGFGRSPKPYDCFYTIDDHILAIQNSVIDPHGLTSFHLVAHSMGCILALALAAKFSKNVKSITFVAPPFIPSSRIDANSSVLHKIAPKRLWPPLSFGIAFMSWYEHLGRSFCFIVCKFHMTWERIAKLLTWRREYHFMTVDMTRHTHHSAWHSMHNVICGGSKLLDAFFDTLAMHRVSISVVHGARDELISLESVEYVRTKVPCADIAIIDNASHESVVLGREREFACHLQSIWESTSS